MNVCDEIKKLADKAPAGPLKDALMAIYNSHCGGGVVHTDDGGGPASGPPPKP